MEMKIENASQLYSQFEAPSYSSQDHKKRLTSKSNLAISFKLGSNEIRQLKRNLMGDMRYPNQKFEIVFNYCDFKSEIEISTNAEVDLVFQHCNFIRFDISHTSQSHKYKFRHCSFENTNFENTEFKNLIDVYNCDFSNSVNFIKTEFHKNAVFAACRFKKNVLFTYTSIDKELILRNTYFYAGLDLSLSIGSGALNCFGIQLSNFKGQTIEAQNQKEYETLYNSRVIESNSIPLENKRETYRIIKQSFSSVGNLSNALHYEYLEKITLESELKKEIQLKKKNCFTKSGISKTTLYAEIIALQLNKWSNQHKKSWLQSCLFIVVVGIPCFFFSSIGSGQYEFSWPISLPTFKTAINHFILFLSPVHSVDYLGKHETLNSGFYIFDFLGRIGVGYGIYQLVQAFRKLK